jgi:hypothetical protein
VKESNWPFHGVKTTFWEGGLRTPLLIRWPDGAGAGSVRGDPVSIADIYPTIVAGIGLAPPPGLDGRAIGREPAPARDLFWETWANGHYGYSVLRDGLWRLYKTWPWTPWEMAPTLFEVTAVPGAPPDVAAAQPERVRGLEDARRAWQREVHRPALHFARDASGGGTLEGLDFLRTPGFGGFSFGIGIKAGFAGNVASQQGTWSMRLSPEGELAADFQGHVLRATLGPGACHSALISAWFSRRSSNWRGDDDGMHIALYIDGEQADSLDAPGRLDDSRFAEPTRTGEPGASNSLLSEPILLNAPVEASDAWSNESLHRELCPPSAS